MADSSIETPERSERHWDRVVRWWLHDKGRQVIYAGCWIPALAAAVLSASGGPLWAAASAPWFPFAQGGLIVVALLFGVASALQCNTGWRRGVCEGNEQVVPLGTIAVILVVLLAP